ncbi:energy transducer TonB [Sphingobium sp. MP9-4]|uniref:energy transducer TonB n=1 Tax=Sphingobium sp. MP9-4 TaxID=1761936 RepID=UPI0010CA8281|nr:energy transducer TonB [Sphingobium sp. MP9-4]
MKHAFLTLPLFAPLLIAAASSPTPTGNPGDRVTSEDYPATALREGQEGVTAFLLDIDKNGVPVKCTISSSSGAATLDQATCDLLIARARFTPARDTNGKPLVGSYSNKINWRIPESDGSASDCVATINDKPMPEQHCATQILSRRYPIQRDSAGNPVRKKMRMAMTFETIEEGK